MKKAYLLIPILFLAFSVVAQYEKHKNIDNSRIKSDQFEGHVPQVINSAVYSTSSNSYGTSIGTSTYDLQSNYGLGSTRLLTYPDGSITGIWTQSLDLNGGHPDRGTGYNFYDPNSQSWGNGETGQYGLSTVRTGWPQIVPLSSGELVLQHDFGQNTVVSNSRPTVGTGAWTSSTSVGFPGSWPRAAAYGDTIHMVTVENGGTVINNINVPMEYHRSDDGGQTWAISSYSNFPGYDTSVFWFADIGADAYAIDAYENYVAVVVGGAWDPLVLYKSDNYGADGSWTQTIISKPDTSYTFYDSVNAIHIVPTLSKETSIVIDDNGLVHISNTGFAVRWDSGQLKPQTAAGQRSYYPTLSSGLYYWNDTMPIIDHVYNDLVLDRIPLPGNAISPISMFYDYTQDSIYNIPGDFDSIGTYNGGAAGHTSIAIDNNGGVFIVWSQVAETNTPIPGFDRYFRDIYFAHSFDGGASWGNIQSLALLEIGDDGISGGTIIEEDVFPSAIKRIGTDDIMHIMFQTDGNPGLHVQGTMHAINTNDIVYYPLNLTQFRPLALEDVNIQKDEISLYPNPSNNNIHIDSKSGESIHQVRLFNTLGMEIQADLKTINQGQRLMDISHLSSGLYILKIQKGQNEISRTFIKD